MPPNHLDQVRRIALALPGCRERPGDGGPEFTIDETPLCSFHDGGPPDDGRVWLCCASPRGVAEEMVGAEPSRFFHPPSTAEDRLGWLGLYLDGTGDDAVDWDEVAAMLADAHVTVTGSGTAGSIDDGIGADPAGVGRFRFVSRLWLHTGEGAWCFATVPPTVSRAVDELQELERRGFGSRRVRVTIGSTTWSTSIFPDASTKTYALPVKKAVRTAERVGEGDDVQITIELVDLPDRT